jgi:nitroreductase
MEFAEVLRRRRMVRQLADEPVERAVLERIVAAARRAPSAGNSQGQRLVVVTDPALRRRVAAACAEDEYAELGFGRWISGCAAQFVPCVSEQIYHDRYREPDKVDDDGDEAAWPVPYWWLDIGATALLVHLAAIDEGLAAGFAGPGDDDGAALRAALGIPRAFVPVGVIPVGRPLPDTPSPSLSRRRVPLDEFARWEGFGPA